MWSRLPLPQIGRVIVVCLQQYNKQSLVRECSGIPETGGKMAPEETRAAISSAQTVPEVTRSSTSSATASLEVARAANSSTKQTPSDPDQKFRALLIASGISMLRVIPTSHFECQCLGSGVWMLRVFGCHGFFGSSGSVFDFGRLLGPMGPPGPPASDLQYSVFELGGRVGVVLCRQLVYRAGSADNRPVVGRPKRKIIADGRCPRRQQ